MLTILKDIIQGCIAAALVFGPMYYFLLTRG